MHRQRPAHPSSLILILAIGIAAGWQRPAPAQNAGVLLYGVTASNRLIAFTSAAPGQLLNDVPIANLAAGERIVGLDMRPANNWLYGLGSTSQLYVINPVTGAAIRIGAPFTPALSGTDFGFDFNPTVDRIRVVSNSGQNLRLHPDTGAAAAVDGALSYAAGDANAGRVPGVTAVAYTNPDNDPATGTTLFDIDAALDVVAVQNPPNDGRLNTQDPLGIDAGNLGFDIGLASDFYASIQSPGGSSSSLFSMIGAQRNALGTIGGGEPVVSLAVSLGAPFSPPAERVYAVNSAGELLGFDANRASSPLSRAALTGLNAGERIVGIDFRPANNLLYGLGSANQLYIIDPRTGISARVGPPLSAPLAGTEFGFDFNPTVDRIRVVGDSGQNLRLHPDTGAVAAVDGTLAYAPSDVNAGRSPRVVGAAYTNPDNNPATGTTLFVIDAGLDLGAVQDPPNAGTLNTFQAFGADVGDVTSFDISFTQILIATAPSASSPTLLFDVANGARRNLGVIGNSETVRGLAISLGR
jgi:hypothetical protein